MVVEKTDRDVQYRDLTTEQVTLLAKLIARDNLPRVNKGVEEFEVPNTFYTRYGKRVLDIVISFVALIITSPIILIVLIVTYFDVGRPIFFRQTRVGKDGRLFTLIKPRNMTNECDKSGRLLPAPERVTKWGRFVRKCSLDELLNFWNILKGDMSIIGPRPMPVGYYNRFSRQHNMRHKVRPGLECPLHDPTIRTMTWDSRFDNDVWYVQNISLSTDVRLLVLLFKEAIWGTNRENRANAEIGGDFLGYTEDGRVMTSEHIPSRYYNELILTGMKLV